VYESLFIKKVYEGLFFQKVYESFFFKKCTRAFFQKVYDRSLPQKFCPKVYERLFCKKCRNAFFLEKVYDHFLSKTCTTAFSSNMITTIRVTVFWGVSQRQNVRKFRLPQKCELTFFDRPTREFPIASEGQYCCSQIVPVTKPLVKCEKTLTK
jgi:hypothetical protein